jgi:hypothetical protein
MGIIYGESQMSPIAQAWDGNGRGLIQIDFYNAVDGQDLSACGNCISQYADPVTNKEACNNCPCLTGPDPDIAKFPRTKENYPVDNVDDISRWTKRCNAFNPLRNLKQAVIWSSGGKTFLPPGKPWWSCGNGPIQWPKNVKMATDEQVLKISAQAIEALTTLKYSTTDFIHPDKCDDKPPAPPPTGDDCTVMSKKEDSDGKQCMVNAGGCDDNTNDMAYCITQDMNWGAAPPRYPLRQELKGAQTSHRAVHPAWQGNSLQTGWRQVRSGRVSRGKHANATTMHCIMYPRLCAHPDCEAKICWGDCRGDGTSGA